MTKFKLEIPEEFQKYIVGHDEPDIDKLGLERYRLKFPNDWGASVIKYKHNNYGEIAVIGFIEDDWEYMGNTPVMNDVTEYTEMSELIDVLNKIKAL